MTQINLKVLDISHHNDVSDFKAIYDFGIRGIIHKATQGTGYVDNRYAMRRQKAKDAGLLWGAYHFADGSDTDRQLAHFIEAAALEPGDLGALDYEPNTTGATMKLEAARQFLLGYEVARGSKAVLYSGNLIKETLGDKLDTFFGSHRLWLAHYRDVPKIPAAWGDKLFLHQFSGDGVNDHGIDVPGISAKVDMNSFSGTDEQLAAAWAG